MINLLATLTQYKALKAQLDSLETQLKEKRTEIEAYMKEKGTGSVGDPHELTRYAKKGGSFSYMFKVKPGKTNYLVCTFLKADNGKSICIKSGFKTIKAVVLNHNESEEKYTIKIKLPESLTKKEQLRISCMGIKKKESARLASPVNTEYL